MDHPTLVRRFERLRDLACNRQRLVQRQGSMHQSLGEIVSLDELHHERMRSTLRGAHHAVDVRDVWMIERGERLRFTLEPRQAVGIVREHRR